MVGVVYISGTRCSTKEKRMLAELLAGKRKKQNDKENFEKVLDRAFEDGQEVKGIYREALKKANLDKAEIKVGEVMARKFDRQKIITGNGIEISIPVDYYQDIDKVEITANSDGTINIIVKNIDEYKSV